VRIVRQSAVVKDAHNGALCFERSMVNLAMRPPPHSKTAIETTITATAIHPTARKANTARTTATAEPIAVTSNKPCRARPQSVCQLMLAFDPGGATATQAEHAKY
jgi:hypothetical protein